VTWKVTGWKHLQTIYLVQDQYPKYVRNSYNSTAKQNEPRASTDVSPKKMWACRRVRGQVMVLFRFPGDGIKGGCVMIESGAHLPREWGYCLTQRVPREDSECHLWETDPQMSHLVTHACNPSSWRGIGGRITDSRPAQVILARLYLQKKKKS
jgi:hypothetical protein